MAGFDWSPIDETVKIGDRTYTRQALESMPPSILREVLYGGIRGGKTFAQQYWEQAQRISEEQRMANQRPYSKLTGAELARTLAGQLEAFRKPEPARDYVDATTVFEAGLKGQDVETVFRVGADGRPEAVTRLVDKPSKDSVRNAGESELAWLKRRVNEICNWRI